MLAFEYAHVVCDQLHDFFLLVDVVEVEGVFEQTPVQVVVDVGHCVLLGWLFEVDCWYLSER